MKIFEVFGQVALEGQQQVQSGLRAIDRRAKRSGGQLQDFGDSVSDVGDKLSKVSGALGAAGGAFTGFLGAMAGVGKRIQDQAAQAGLATDEFQRLEHVFEGIGLKGEDVSDAMATLNERAQEAIRGGGEARKTFERLGISIDELRDASSQQRFNMVADAMADLESAGKRSTAAVRLFGDEIGRRLAPTLAKGSERIDQMGQDAFVLSDKFLEMSSKFRRGLSTVGSGFQKLGAIVAKGWLPVFNQQVFPFFRNDLFPALKDAAQFLGDLGRRFRELPPAVQKVIGILAGVVTVVGPLLSIGGRLLSLFGAWIPMLMALNPVILLVSAAIAGLVIGFTRAESISRALARAWQWVMEQLQALWAWLQGAWQSFREALVTPVRQAVRDVIRWFERMARAVRENVAAMVNWVTERFDALETALVGNSIVPDMVDGVVGEMGRMADQGIREADRMARGVQRAADMDVATRIGVQQRRAGRAAGMAGGIGQQTVDLRHSIIRDGRDLEERLSRNGVGLTGAF